MDMKSFTCKVLGPGYGVIIGGCVIENAVFGTTWFQLGTIIGFLWIAVGLVGLMLTWRELKKSDGYMLVQTGPYAVSRNPVMAANLFGVMPGLCLLLNTNLGILGIAASAYLFFKHVTLEEMALEDRFGETYQAYRERVGRLLPASLF